MTIDGRSGVRLEGARYAAARAARAGVVGAGFGGVLAWVLAGAAQRDAGQAVRQVDSYAGIGEAIVAFFVLPLLALPVGWLLLRWLDVRPAWAVAVLGVLFSRSAFLLAWSLLGKQGSEPSAWIVVPSVAAGYLASALVVAPRLRIPYRVAAGAMALGAVVLAYFRVG